MDTIIIAAVFVIYLGVMVVIGMKYYNKEDDMSEYILGGRKLPPIAVAMSAQASDMSGWLLTGLPGLAYILYAGTSEAIWTAVGLALGTYLNWFFVARRLRKYTQVAGNAITLPAFFENRFRDKKPILRMVSGIFTVIFFLVYTSSQMVAGGKLFTTVFDMDYTLGMIIVAIIVLAYTALGGFTAVCWTDTIQGIIMFFALLIVPIVACVHVGGPGAVAENLAQLTDETLHFFPETTGGHIDSLLLASALGWGLGYFGQPHILVRFMAIENSEMIKTSRRMAMVWVVLTLSAAVLVGLIGKAFMPDLADGETVYMEMIDALFNPVLAGVMLIAILAATMSTASSQLLVTASSVSRDIYAILFKKEGEEKQLVWVSRVAVVAVSVIAIFLGLDPNSSIFSLVSCAWGGIGATFGPLILFSLFWKRMTLAGAIAGMIVGGVTDLLWYNLSGGVFDIYEIIPGFLFSSLAIIVFSLLTKPSKEIVEEFESVKDAEI